MPGRQHLDDVLDDIDKPTRCDGGHPSTRNPRATIEILQARLREQTLATQAAATQARKGVLEAIQRAGGLPDGVSEGHPIEQLVGTVLAARDATIWRLRTEQIVPGNKFPPLPGELEIQRVWNVSTTHISKEDADILGCSPATVPTAPRAIIPFPYHEFTEGWWLCVLRGEDRVDPTQLHSAGLSSAVSHIWSLAHQHEVDWVHLDADAPIYNFLRQFHW